VSSGAFNLSATITQPVLDTAPGLTVAGLSGTISKVTVTLSGWTGGNTDFGSQLDREFFLAYTPSGGTAHTYEFLSQFGGISGFSNVTVTLDDSAAAGHSPEDAPGISSNSTYTFLPTVPNIAGNQRLPSSGPIASNTNIAAQGGTATFASVFNGLAAN